LDIQTVYDLTMRRACRLIQIPRPTAYYRNRKRTWDELRIRLRDLATVRVRYGYRRLHVLLRREGWRVNHKLVWRIYREEGLSLRMKGKKKKVSRLRGRTPAEQSVLRYPRGTLVVGVVCSVFFLSLALLSILFPGKDGSPTISLVFVGFAFLGAPLIVEYYRVVHYLEKGGIRYSSLISSPGFLPWSDIKSVRYAPSLKWFRIEGRDGRIIRVSVMLMGLPEFARAVLSAVSESRIEPAARSLLERTAEGHPPSLWG
jgi:hypothetical protein